MHKILIYILSFLLIILFPGTAHPQGGKRTINVGYFEGGAYFLHKAIMGELREYLDNLSGEQYEIVFDPFGYKSAEWNRNICRAMAGDLVRKKNLDIIIAAGPWVVEDLIGAGFDKPIVAIHQPYPELSGLVDGNGRPVYPNLTVTYEPGKLESDLKALSRLFPKSKCGFVYFPSNDEFGRVAEKAKQVGARYELKIVPAEAYSESGVYSFFISRDKIQKEIEVLYLPPLCGLDLDMLREFFTQVHFNRVATFVSEGFLLLEKGAIAANCNRPYRSEARIAADKIDRIIRGAAVSDLPTRFSEFQIPGINPNEAIKIGLRFDKSSLSNAKMVTEIPDEAIERYRLADALEQARRENADFQTRILSYERAMIEARKAYSDYLPNLSAQIGGATGDNGIEIAQYNETLNRKSFAEISLEQKLFSYSAIKAIQAAQKGKEIENLNLKTAEIDLKLVISTAFISIVENEEKVTALNETVDRLRDYLEIVRTDYQLGVVSSQSIPLIEERLLNARIELINATNELQISRVILNCLWNRPSDSKFVLNRTDFDNSAMLTLMQKIDSYSDGPQGQERLTQFFVNYGIDNSAAMKTADLSIGRHRDLMAENRGKNYPELSLQAKYSYGREFNPILSAKRDFWLIGAVINIPIFPGQIWDQDKKILRYQSDELTYRKDALRLELMRDITAKIERLYGRMATLPLNYESRTLSRQNLEAEADNYGKENLQYDNLLRLEQNLAGREIRLIEDKYGFFRAYIELLFAIGESYLPSGSDEEKLFFEKVANHFIN